MKVLVYGAGAMGLYFAGRLAQVGHEIYLKARTEWGGNSVTVQTSEKSDEVVPLAGIFTELPDQLDVDVVILATKAWQIAEIVQDLRGKIPSDAAILTVQNGIAAPEKASELLEEAPIVGSTCVVIVQRITPGVVNLLGQEATLVAGEFTSSDGEGLSAVTELFENTPIEVTGTNDIRRALWKKLALISSYGAVGAVSNLPVGQTRSHESTRQMVLDSMNECAEVARAHGVGITQDDIADIFSIYAEGFEEGTTSSMQRDLAEGKPSELDDQVGEVVRRAHAIGVKAPTQNFMYRALLAREEIARNGRTAKTVEATN